MSAILEQAKHHFRELIQGQGLHCIDVSEWSEKDKPAKLYFRPLAALPVHTYSKVVALGLQQTVEAFVDILILRCLDKNVKQGQKPLHLVSVWAAKNRLVLGQVKTEEKSNEIQAIPKLLGMLEVQV
jgi:hypothetical protein